MLIKICHMPISCVRESPSAALRAIADVVLASISSGLVLGKERSGMSSFPCFSQFLLRHESLVKAAFGGLSFAPVWFLGTISSFWFVSEATAVPAGPAALASVPIELLVRELRAVKIETVAVYGLSVSLVNSKTTRVLANI